MGIVDDSGEKAWSSAEYKQVSEAGREVAQMMKISDKDRLEIGRSIEKISDPVLKLILYVKMIQVLAILGCLKERKGGFRFEPAC